MDSVVILASGGINSTVAAASAARDAEVNLLFADYGHPACPRERSAVPALADALKAERVMVIELPHLAQINDAHRRIDREAPADVGRSSGAVSALPAVISTLLLAGVQWATRLGAQRVVCGASQVNDETEGKTLPGEGRPDRSAESFHVFNMMLESTLRRRRVVVETPFIDLTRTEIVRLGIHVAAPLELTWTCHKGCDEPCGGCPGCVGRSTAFAAIGTPDPALADTLHG